MAVVVGLAVGLIIAGLVMAWLAPGLKMALLVSVVFWTGVVITIVGLILLISPVILWVNAQLHQMLGT